MDSLTSVTFRTKWSFYKLTVFLTLKLMLLWCTPTLVGSIRNNYMLHLPKASIPPLSTGELDFFEQEQLEEALHQRHGTRTTLDFRGSMRWTSRRRRARYCEEARPWEVKTCPSLRCSYLTFKTQKSKREPARSYWKSCSRHLTSSDWIGPSVAHGGHLDARIVWYNDSVNF